MTNIILNKALIYIKKYKGLISSILITLSYLFIRFYYPFEIDNLNSNSITCLSILFGFNMIVVTQYYSNVNFNLFLKKIGKFNGFKERYRQMVIYLIISLIIIYTLSIFEKLEFTIFDFVSKSSISNSGIIFLSLFNLFKSFEIIQEFFNVYGTTYSNTFNNVNDNKSESNEE